MVMRLPQAETAGNHQGLEEARKHPPVEPSRGRAWEILIFCPSELLGGAFQLLEAIQVTCYKSQENNPGTA